MKKNQKKTKKNHHQKLKKEEKKVEKVQNKKQQKSKILSMILTLTLYQKITMMVPTLSNSKQKMPVTQISLLSIKTKKMSRFPLEEAHLHVDLLKNPKPIKKIMIYTEHKYKDIPTRLQNIFNNLLMKRKTILIQEQEMSMKM